MLALSQAVVHVAEALGSACLPCLELHAFLGVAECSRVEALVPVELSGNLVSFLGHLLGLTLPFRSAEFCLFESTVGPLALTTLGSFGSSFRGCLRGAFGRNHFNTISVFTSGLFDGRFLVAGCLAFGIRLGCRGRGSKFGLEYGVQVICRHLNLLCHLLSLLTWSVAPRCDCVFGL